MKRKFWLDGVCSTDFGIVASGENTFDAAERDVEMISVPGHNGDLILDNGRFKNKTVQYPVAIFRNFSDNAERVRAWLGSSANYRRLEDAYSPDTFRMASFVGPLDFSMQFLNRVGETTLYFNCKPQRFYKSGERLVDFTEPSKLYNPTAFAAKPVIWIYGSGAGTLTVGGTVVEIKAITDQFILDSDTENAYRHVADGAPENKNGDIKAPVFPELLPGENVISWTGDITRVEIKPRWWTL